MSEQWSRCWQYQPAAYVKCFFTNLTEREGDFTVMGIKTLFQCPMDVITVLLKSDKMFLHTQMEQMLFC